MKSSNSANLLTIWMHLRLLCAQRGNALWGELAVENFANRTPTHDFLILTAALFAIVWPEFQCLYGPHNFPPQLDVSFWGWTWRGHNRSVDPQIPIDLCA